MREYVDCPFRTIDSLLTYLRDKTAIIIVDFHAETTAEKAGLSLYLDGKVSAVVGTHTHVQTADERILPRGTAFITDLGMVGAMNGMLGMKASPIIQAMTTQMPTKFEVELEGPYHLCGAVITVDQQSGKALAIEKVHVVDEVLTSSLIQD
jgi:metallophosphoesterase (TIGR00282 family)